jgi:hypothetical protein
MPSNPKRHRTALLVAVLAAAACHAPPHQAPAVLSAAPASASLTAADPGAALLAGVENAQGAIAGRDPVAALNDVNQALVYAVRLPDVASALYPNEAAPPGQRSSRADQPLTSFDVLVQLTTAQAELENGDAARAEADLAAIEAGTPARLAPKDLPLLCADEALAAAQTAVASERTGELRTQFITAQQALDAYAGPHQGDAHALAAALRAELAQPGELGRLQPALLSSWSNRVDGWT